MELRVMKTVHREQRTYLPNTRTFLLLMNSMMKI